MKALSLKIKKDTARGVLQFVRDGSAIFKGVILSKSAGERNIPQPVKSCGYAFRCVGIGSEGDYSAAQFLKASDHFGTWIGDSIRIRGKHLGVDVKSLAVICEVFENLIYPVLKALVGIGGIVLGKDVAGHIVQVPQNVKIVKESDVL